MLPIWLVIVIAVICFGIAAVIFWFVSKSSTQKSYESKIGSAEEKARSIIDDALKTAESKKREALLEVKEESIRVKSAETNYRNTREEFFRKKSPWTKRMSR